MRIIHNLEDFLAPWDHSVVTLGVFDGIHRGHTALFHRLQKRSKNQGARVLVTYHPHPDIVLGKREDSRCELFTYEEKLSLLQKYDLDATVFLEFTPELASMTATDYLETILLGKLKARRIIIGYDQTFGRGRGGDFRFLKERQKRYGFTVEKLTEVRYRGRVVSSSLIRSLVGAGDFVRANRYLGHNYFVTGTVVRGNRRGRVLGFPTINLEISESKVLPGEGVYAGYAVFGGMPYPAMINVGKNPTFHQEYLTIEAHLLDFSGEIYGERIRLYFVKKIREEMRFSSADDLRTQLVKDRTMVLKEKIKMIY